MRQRKITVADVCDITGYQRDELSYLLKELPPYSTQSTVARIAREFAPLDLLTLSVIHFLDKNCGLRLRAIAQVSEQLRQVLSVPRTVTKNAGLAVSIQPSAVEFLELPAKVAAGIVVPLQKVFERVDHFCNAFQIETMAIQPELDFGPVLVKVPHAKTVMG